MHLAPVTSRGAYVGGMIEGKRVDRVAAGIEQRPRS
jgi:hypothetical protein